MKISNVINLIFMSIGLHILVLLELSHVVISSIKIERNVSSACTNYGSLHLYMENENSIFLIGIAVVIPLTN